MMCAQYPSRDASLRLKRRENERQHPHGRATTDWDKVTYVKKSSTGELTGRTDACGVHSSARKNVKALTFI